jgi:molybdopterin synthase catalytic subunit
VIVGLRSEPFAPWPLLAEAEQALDPADREGCGASSVFLGTMRADSEPAPVLRMHLEHYPGMAERMLARMADEACHRWPLRQLVLVHRVGWVAPGETLVVAAVWCGHRGEAFAACRYLVETVKHQAPFWKREFRADGSADWVAANTPAPVD